MSDEDPGLRIESFAVINLRGVSTNKTIYFIAMQTYKELRSHCIMFLSEFMSVICVNAMVRIVACIDFNAVLKSSSSVHERRI